MIWLDRVPRNSTARQQRERTLYLLVLKNIGRTSFSNLFISWTRNAYVLLGLRLWSKEMDFGTLFGGSCTHETTSSSPICSTLVNMMKRPIEKQLDFLCCCTIRVKACEIESAEPARALKMPLIGLSMRSSLSLLIAVSVWWRCDELVLVLFASMRGFIAPTCSSLPFVHLITRFADAQCPRLKLVTQLQSRPGTDYTVLVQVWPSVK